VVWLIGRAKPGARAERDRSAAQEELAPAFRVVVAAAATRKTDQAAVPMASKERQARVLTMGN